MCPGRGLLPCSLITGYCCASRCHVPPCPSWGHHQVMMKMVQVTSRPLELRQSRCFPHIPPYLTVTNMALNMPLPRAALLRRGPQACDLGAVRARCRPAGSGGDKMPDGVSCWRAQGRGCVSSQRCHGFSSQISQQQGMAPADSQPSCSRGVGEGG